MSIKIEIKGFKEFGKDAMKFAEELRTEAQVGLSDHIDSAVEDLKEELKTTVNNQIASAPAEQTGKDVRDQTLDIPKSEVEIINQLLNIDITKFRTDRGYSTQVDSGVTVVTSRDKLKEKGIASDVSRMSSGVNFRMSMSEMDTFDSQFGAAQNHFNNTVFMLEEGGKINYYINPGINLSNYVKVVCSRETGNTAASNKKFEKHRVRRNYADWTLTAEGLGVVKNKFIKLNDVVDSIKDGRYDDAIAILNSHKVGNDKIQKVADEIKNIKTSKNLKPTTQAYVNIITLISNLKVRKTTSENKTTYSLYTNYGNELSDTEEQFLDTIKSEVFIWKITNEQKWIDTITKAVNRVVEKFNKQG